RGRTLVATAAFAPASIPTIAAEGVLPASQRTRGQPPHPSGPNLPRATPALPTRSRLSASQFVHRRSADRGGLPARSPRADSYDSPVQPTCPLLRVGCSQRPLVSVSRPGAQFL